MPLVKSKLVILLTPEERNRLKILVNQTSAPFGQVIRARVVLGIADRLSISEVSRRTGYDRNQVRKWAKRFITKRLAGLEDEARSGRPPTFSPSGVDGADQARVPDAR